MAENQPFTKAKAYFTDAKFYLEDEVIPEALPISVPISNKTYKGKEVQDSTSGSFPSAKHQGDQEICKYAPKLTLPISTKITPILCYVPKSRRKEGDSLFKEITNKEKSPLSDVSLKTLQEDLVLPAYAILNTVVSKPSLE